jgi:epoxyqueuosine reductase
VPEPIPEAYRAELGAQVYGCDICQDVCPWNRGVERRRAADEPDPAAHVDLLSWLDGDRQLDEDLLGRLYVPRNDARWLRRNALVALGNERPAAPGAHAVLEAHAGGEDGMLSEHARWALERLSEEPGREAGATCS